MSARPRRQAELIEAAIREIGSAGSLEVTVGQIARRAGVSPALAFHYFGDKDQLFLAAMRHILSIYAAEVRVALTNARTPGARLRAIVGASFAPTNFRDDFIAAWLNFYVLAQRSEKARRLLWVYHRRLHSNLTHDLRGLVGDRAPGIAARLGAQIDGVYVRAACNLRPLTGESATTQILAMLDESIGAER